MQFGVFSVTTSPGTRCRGRHRVRPSGSTPSCGSRGRPRRSGWTCSPSASTSNPPFFSSAPTTPLSFIAATTERLIVSTATTLITTNDPVRTPRNTPCWQHLSKGRVDLMLGGNTAPVYPWFGQDIRQGLPLALENYNLLHRLWREDVVDWEGSSALRCRASPRSRGCWTTCRRSCGTARSASEIAEQAAYYGDGFFANHIFWPKEHFMRLIGFYRQRYAHYGHGTEKQAVVGQPGVHRPQVAGRHPGVPPVFQRGAGLRARPVAGGLHADDAVVGGQPAGGHRQDLRPSASTSPATTSASCS